MTAAKPDQCVCGETSIRNCPVHGNIGSLSEELIEERRQEALREWTDEEILAAWKRGELVVRTGRIIHGNLCVCPEKGDGEWCDKCEGYAMEQGQ